MVAPPTPEDRFSFGLWTVGWQGSDPFGGADPPGAGPVEAIDKLAEIGAWGITFHDNDVFPFDADEATQDRIVGRLQGRHRRAPAWSSRWSPPTPFTHPVFKDGGLTSNDRGGAPVRAAQGAARRRPGRRARRRRRSSCGAGARAASTTAPRTSTPRSSATRRASTPSPATSRRRATTSRSRWSPSRTSRAATSSCPPSGTPWR